MSRRLRAGFVIATVFLALSGGRHVAADGDAALGRWRTAAAAKLSAGRTLDAFLVRIEKKAAGYQAASRAEVTTEEGRVVVLVTYAGAPSGDKILFRSTARLRTVDGGEPVQLDPASLLVTPKEDRIEVRVGNEAEGYTDLTLERNPDAGDPADVQRIRGEWYRDMSSRELSEKVFLDEMALTVPTEGAWTAKVRMECTVVVGEKKVPVTVVADYADGQVDGGRVRFAIVPWHRTVPSTGQKNDLVGNPLVLELTAGGELSGTFEGSDGWSFTLPRLGAAPAEPKPVDVGVLAGAWGGDFDDAKLNDTLLVRVAKLDVATKSGGDWSATVEFLFVVKTGSGDALVKLAGSYPPGRVDGDAIKFPTAQLTRTIVSTGAQNVMDGNPLELRREPDGRLEAKFVGDGGFTLTMAKR
jgi:hypothetical protein